MGGCGIVELMLLELELLDTLRIEGPETIREDVDEEKEFCRDTPAIGSGWAVPLT